MSNTSAYYKLDKMLLDIQELIDNGDILIRSIRQNFRAEIDEDEYPALIVSMSNVETFNSIAAWSEGDATFRIMLLDYLDDYSDEEEYNTKKEPLMNYAKTIVNKVLDYGEMQGTIETQQTLDNSNDAVMVTLLIKK